MSRSSNPAIEALGSSSTSKGGTILPLLLENVRDPNPRVRALAVRELSDYTDKIAIELLLELAEHDPDLEVRCAALSGLGNYVYVGGVSDYDLDTDLELACVEECLPDADFERVYNLLLVVCHDKERTLDEKRSAVESLSYYGNEAVEELIAGLYARPEKEAKISALVAMGCNGAARWVDVLRSEFANPDLDVRIEAIHAAGDLGLDGLGKDLWWLTYSEDRDVVLAAIWSLGQTGWDGAFERLDELTLHADPLVRECADEAMEEWLFYNGLAQERDQNALDRYLDEE